MMAVEKEDGTVVTGPAVRALIKKKAAKVNADKEIDVDPLDALLDWALPDVEESSEPAEEAERLLTWRAIMDAIGRIQPGKGVGCDGFDGYLLKRAAPEVWKVWLEILRGMVRYKDYPHEWNEWIAMLAMKPGERPTNFERRRDLWLIPHSQKILTRMVNVEYDRAARRCVLSLQAGLHTWAQRGGARVSDAAGGGTGHGRAQASVP